MSNVTVITNHVPRDVLDSYELSEAERAEFDYYDWTALDEGRDSASFFRYKGETYDLGEFMATREILECGELGSLRSWDGYQSDSFFSGILVQYVDEFERVIVGRYYS